MTTKDIANLLELALQTVRTYRRTLMKKMGVTNAATLTQAAFAAGLIISSTGSVGTRGDFDLRLRLEWQKDARVLG
jgi:Bacterial regulatory proteins, luxR family